MTDTPTVPQMPQAAAPKAHLGLIIAGYVCAAISIVFMPIVFAVAAIVIGIVTIRKGAKGHGIAHIVLGAVFLALSMFVGVASNLYG